MFTCRVSLRDASAHIVYTCCLHVNLVREASTHIGNIPDVMSAGNIWGVPMKHEVCCRHWCVLSTHEVCCRHWCVLSTHEVYITDPPDRPVRGVCSLHLLSTRDMYTSQISMTYTSNASLCALHLCCLHLARTSDVITLDL